MPALDHGQLKIASLQDAQSPYKSLHLAAFNTKSFLLHNQLSAITLSVLFYAQTRKSYSLRLMNESYLRCIV